MKFEEIVLNLSRDILIVDFYEGLEIFISIYIKSLKVNIAIFNKTRKVITFYIDIKIFI